MLTDVSFGCLDLLLDADDYTVGAGRSAITPLGLTQKAAFACGSMVLFISVRSFFTLQGEKERTESKKPCTCVSPNLNMSPNLHVYQM
jgi:hypothetical protein